MYTLKKQHIFAIKYSSRKNVGSIYYINTGF